MRILRKCEGGPRRMALQKTQRDEIVEEFKVHESDTGSPEVQVALLAH